MPTPEGWSDVKFGDLFVESSARRGSRTDAPVLSVTKTRGPMLASERFGKVMHGRDLSVYRLAPRGTLVVDPMLLWDGSIGIQDAVEVGVVSPDYRVFEIGERAHPRYVAYLVRDPSMLPLYQGGARGTNVRRNRIARADFLRIPAELPPLAEQRKIAAILSSVDETVEKTEAVVARLQVVKKAMMQELLTRGMPGRHTRFKQTEIGEIPESWEMRRLDPELVAIDAGWSPLCDARPAQGQDWGVLKVSAVSSGVYKAAENKSLPATLPPRPASEVQAGDVLLARASGVLELVGRTAFVFETPPRLMLSDKIMRLRPAPALSGLFLHYSLQANCARKQVMELCGGSHMRNLSQDALRQVRIALPQSAEQEEIAAAVRSIESSLEVEQRTLDRLGVVKTSLSAALLSGEIRVPTGEPST